MHDEGRLEICHQGEVAYTGRRLNIRDAQHISIVSSPMVNTKLLAVLVDYRVD